MARHTPSDQQRNAVTVMIGLGAPHKIIADGLNIELETFEKVYEREIENGPATVKLELAKQLFNSAKADDGAGKVTAAVKLLELLSGEERAEVDRNTIRIRPPAEDYSHQRMVWVGCHPSEPMPEMFTRAGEKVITINTLPGDDKV